MKRKLPNWLEAYQEYTEETESNPMFNTWVGLSTIASALRKKTWLDVGRLKVFPNMYIVLVADPGIARKSQAISYATDLLRGIPEIRIAADSTTAQSLLQELEESTTYDRLEDGTPIRHASLSIVSKEFESFLGIGGSKMMVTLTDMFDAGEQPWIHKTKSSGTSIIPSVFLNILGATTPRSLQDCLSQLAVGGGLTSRIIFVYSNKKHKKIAIPELTGRVRELKDLLSHDLNLISKIVGSYQYSPDALQYWKEWYEGFDENSKERLQPRREFDGWYSRKPLMLQKLCLLLASSKSSVRTIKVTDVDSSIHLLTDIEKEMGYAVANQTEVSAKSIQNEEIILKYINHYKSINEKHLMQLIWRNIDEVDFDIHMDNLLRDKRCERKLVSPTGEPSIWYHSKEN